MKHVAASAIRSARNTRLLAARTLAFWFGLAVLPQACADGIYIYTSDEGTVTLSNVPTDEKYTLMLSAPRDPPLPSATDAICQHAPCLTEYSQIILDAARANGLDSALIHAVISVESQYNPKAVSRKGAIGLMQLMPSVANRYGVVDLYDPAQNIRGGARYLHDLLALFNGDLELALAAYNAGERAVARYGNRIPPFRETSKYVPRVLHFYQKYRVR